MFTGKEEHEIPLDEAAELTRRYRDTYPSSKKGGYFSRDAIETLLDQENCVGIRIYYAINEGGNMGMVVVGVSSDENDQIGENDVCMDNCIPCPSRCGIEDVLNSDI